MQFKMGPLQCKNCVKTLELDNLMDFESHVYCLECFETVKLLDQVRQANIEFDFDTPGSSN